MKPSFKKEDEAVVYQFTNELYINRKISNQTFFKAVRVIGEGGVIDLVGILGYYSLISMTINVFEITE